MYFSPGIWETLRLRRSAIIIINCHHKDWELLRKTDKHEIESGVNASMDLDHAGTKIVLRLVEV